MSHNIADTIAIKVLTFYKKYNSTTNNNGKHKEAEYSVLSAVVASNTFDSDNLVLCNNYEEHTKYESKNESENQNDNNSGTVENKKYINIGQNNLNDHNNINHNACTNLSTNNNSSNTGNNENSTNNDITNTTNNQDNKENNSSFSDSDFVVISMATGTKCAGKVCCVICLY